MGISCAGCAAVGGWGDRAMERGGNFIAYMRLSKYYIVMSVSATGGAFVGPK